MKEGTVLITVESAEVENREYEVVLFRLNFVITRLVFKLNQKAHSFSIPVERQYGVLRVLLKAHTDSVSLSDYVQERLVFIFPPSTSFASMHMDETTVDVSQSVNVTLTSQKPASCVVSFSL